MIRLYTRLLCLCALVVLAWPLVSHAKPFTRGGTYAVHLHPKVLRTSARSKMASSHTTTKAELTFSVQKITLSKTARSEIVKHIKQTLSTTPTASSIDNQEASNGSSEKQFLGMNGVPVLDQGAWGSCVTFAVTAALDANYGLYDNNQISQLCDLELGLTLQTAGEEGGWDGANGSDILQQIAQYGYLTQGYEHHYGCGGLSSYPIYSDNHGSAMSIRSFQKASPDRRFSDSDWQEILGENISDAEFIRQLEHPELTLADVKAAIRRGHRVAIGIILNDTVGDAGAVGTYKGYRDTWILNDQVESAIERDDELGGHELVVTGFDDGCISVSDDSDAKQVCGYLVARNSWTSLAGDRGDYYISYDYFKYLSDEAYEIG